MNTKQVLYNALQGQLEVKKQAYENYRETVTQPAYDELSNEVKAFIESFIPIGDAKFEFSNRKISVNNGSNWGNAVDYTFNQGYNKEKSYVEVDWNGGSYNLIDKSYKKETINFIFAFVNNLKSVEDKWINEWYPKYNDIYDADHKVKSEYSELQTALSNLKSEIHIDYANSMKQKGFELKSFKQKYDLDWDYENNERVYKIVTSKQSIKVQYGRSQYDNIYVNGFKVLGKTGNKYNIEVYREGYPDKTYNVLEKKFDTFVDDVVNWENVQADKRKADTEKSFADRSK